MKEYPTNEDQCRRKLLFKVLLNIPKVTCRLLNVDVVRFVQKFVCVQHVQIQMTKCKYMMCKKLAKQLRVH